MKMTLGVRLALSYLAVILAVMGIAAALAWLAVENLYLDTQRANLLAQAQTAAAALQGGVAAPEDPPIYNQTTNTMPGIHTRVINAQGAVVIDMNAAGQGGGGLDLPQLAQNAAGLVTAEELLARPEIAGALAGKAETAIRQLDIPGGGRVLYAAAPVFAADGSVSQIVYLASPLPDTQWQALPEGVRWQFVGLLLFAVALVSIAGLLLARRISRPLAKLADAAHGVAGGDLAQTVPEDAAIVELSVLGRAFNSMTASLRQSDQAKTAFISDVSHELRTPLTVIKGSIETLQDGALDDLEMRGQFLNSMNLETERMIRLVNDLLVLTRADAGALNLHLQTVDLGELARSRCEKLSHTAELRQVHLLPSFEAVPYPVRADADRLAQVLDNLLDNAIRYSPPGGEVRVTLQREGDRIVCQVVDQGAGIPANHLPFIFERFYRVESARDRSASDGNTSQVGSGLGLAIVRSLVTAHGGDVSVTSREDRGTTFSFWLPADNNP